MAEHAEEGGDGVAGEGLQGTGQGEGVNVDAFFLFFVATLLRDLPDTVGFLACLPSAGAIDHTIGIHVVSLGGSQYGDKDLTTWLEGIRLA